MDGIRPGFVIDGSGADLDSAFGVALEEPDLVRLHVVEELGGLSCEHDLRRGAVLALGDRAEQVDHLAEEVRVQASLGLLQTDGARSLPLVLEYEEREHEHGAVGNLIGREPSLVVPVVLEDEVVLSVCQRTNIYISDSMDQSS